MTNNSAIYRISQFSHDTVFLQDMLTFFERHGK